jgi:hypothetical protein
MVLLSVLASRFDAGAQKGRRGPTGATSYDGPNLAYDHGLTTRGADRL